MKKKGESMLKTVNIVRFGKALTWPLPIYDNQFRVKHRQGEQTNKSTKLTGQVVATCSTQRQMKQSVKNTAAHKVPANMPKIKNDRKICLIKQKFPPTLIKK